MKLATLARCLEDGCTWTAAGPGSQADADRHMRTRGHAVSVVSRPATPDAGYSREVLEPPADTR